MAGRILVVDDELPIVELLSYNLKRANYEVLIARDGEEALRVAGAECPDLVILDLMLPKLDGLEVCRVLRRERDIPIIMLTARDAEVDRVVGLQLGADDYVVKPFSVRELLARVRNVLHRTASKAVETARPVVRTGSLSVDPARFEARLGDVLLELTPLEFDLLYTLAGHAGQVLRREQLLEQVWDYDDAGDVRLVDSAVKRLRRKLRQAGPGRELVVTVRGVGYKLQSP